MVVNISKVKIAEGLRCKCCNQHTLYPVIYTNDITFTDIIDKEFFICENCGKRFYVLKQDGVIRFQEDLEK